MLDLAGRRRGGGLTADFHRLFDAAPEPLALLDGAGTIRAANPALARLVGPAVPLRVGLAAATLVAAPARPALTEHIAAARRQPEPPPLRVPPAAADVPEAEWELACRAIQLAGGSGTLLLRVADRTESKRVEARLREASRLETVGRLAGGIAHDFNNLLTAILGAADAAANAPDRERAADELRQIEDAARRGAGLVGQLLAFARQQVLRPAVIELNTAVAAAAPLLGRMLGDRITLELALQEPSRCVRVDPSQLDQVLMNLVANARSAMPEGGTLRIATGHTVVLEQGGSLPPGRYVLLEITDTGCGMTPEMQARIFEPFFTSRPERGGTGLGLATVQGIVAQHGGRIIVRSAPGQGSTFRIELPRHDGGVERLAAPNPAPAPAVPTILLVEDEAALRRLAERVLQRAGHAVRVATDAEEALDMVEAGPAPTALVTDVAMPGLDGVGLADRLRERWPDLPVLLMSGYAASVCAEDLPGKGFHFLQKPYAPAQLEAAVRALIMPAH